MHNSLSLDDNTLERLLENAALAVRKIGRIAAGTAANLEARGVNVGALETRLLSSASYAPTQQGAA